ncbi:uncharacterized protein [Gossypium hirsutum]|uniref:Uncharacterized protein n=6 Tax=Gossypium TaxID=3633 RepID=A0A1U8ITR4_GOSHI|nr:uncharacterized protein LOC107900343 [Gossypium hirsutum]
MHVLPPRASNFQTIKEFSNPFSAMNTEQRHLRKVVSDVTLEMERYIKTASSSTEIDDEVKQAECECCGLEEDCTADYIRRVKGRHCGKWVCGLCSEAVNERLYRSPMAGTEEAVRCQREFCQRFNSTTRLNPKLSLTCAMRDIAKRSNQNRSSNTPNKIGRSNSCVPKINLNNRSF